MSRKVKECVVPSESFACPNDLSMKDLILSLQVYTAESEILSLGLRRVYEREESKRKELIKAHEAVKLVLNRAHEIHRAVKSRNKELEGKVFILEEKEKGTSKKSTSLNWRN
ncbi:hypothetical protein J1N35_022776 [Gossypium stocksii]|uniref:Uncharacterized protein n=1 Tax=Gossypium stocksii TaxID=47602 RepID=A0A9D3VGM6_9ROSI|nr:hypothetical protein J1N35_022776 [Gossypium stocksii]